MPISRRTALVASVVLPRELTRGELRAFATFWPPPLNHRLRENPQEVDRGVSREAGRPVLVDLPPRDGEPETCASEWQTVSHWSKTLKGRGGTCWGCLGASRMATARRVTSYVQRIWKWKILKLYQERLRTSLPAPLTTYVHYLGTGVGGQLVPPWMPTPRSYSCPTLSVVYSF